MVQNSSGTTETNGAYSNPLAKSVLFLLICFHFFCVATEIEKSQPVNIPDAAKRKKKKRTRATDSSTGTFDGNEAENIVTRTKKHKPLLQSYM